MYLTKENRKAISRTSAVIIIIIILVIGVAAGAYFYHSPKTTYAQISLAPSTITAQQGVPITFTVYNTVSGAVTTLLFGDGQSANGTTVNHAYSNPGLYLVAATETVSGQIVASTFNKTQEIQVTPVINNTLAPLISVPIIAMNITLNPQEPVVNINTPAYFYGGYLEAPTGNDMQIISYTWNFGNGITKTIPASNVTYDPTINPVNVTYSQPGLYPVSLTITTQNTSSMQTYSYTVMHTVAVSSSTEQFTIYKYSGTVPNPSVINVAENVPGGPYSFDPQIDYETVGAEVIDNTMGTLLVYNGSSVSQFIPMLAQSIPTVQNGGITNNYTTYTFTIRSGLNFSNGQPITAYDVWYTTIRALLFQGGSPGTADWILAQYLIPNLVPFVPIMQSANDTADFNAIMSAVTYNNATNTVTFHLVSPTVPSLFFTAIADPLGGGVLNAAWLESVGAGITFTPAGFYEYQNQANEGNYNLKVQTDPVASGPYQIESYVPGQSVVLTPNPGFKSIPGIPAPNDTVVIQWVKDPETAYNLFTSGQADIVLGLPSNYMPSIKQQVASGTATMYSFPTLSIFFYPFNMNISTTAMKSVFGSNFNVPPTYFANPLVREAFAYAFNYTNYIDELVGNSIYGVNFGTLYAGMIPQGMIDYVPMSQLKNVPTYNLTYATQLMKESGEYNISVTIPLSVNSGDTVDYAAMQMWAAALHQMDPNINAVPEYQNWGAEIGEMAPGINPMATTTMGWAPDYPYPSDYLNAMFLTGGTYPAAYGWTVSWMNKSGYPAEASLFQQMNNLIIQADTTSNATLAAHDYQQANQIGINLYLYVYTIQSNQFWIIKPYIHAYQNNIGYQENPMFGGGGDSLYYWWVKN